MNCQTSKHRLLMRLSVVVYRRKSFLLDFCIRQKETALNSHDPSSDTDLERPQEEVTEIQDNSWT